MGACQSCLGARPRDSYNLQQEEDSGLLYDEANGVQYGSFGEQGINGDNDTLETRRETEAIQNVVAKTSENLVDVFEVAPSVSGPMTSTNFAYAGQGARLARYQHLVSKLSSDEGAQPGDIKVGWLADDDNVDMPGTSPVSLRTQEGDGAALVGTFADAAAAANNQADTTTTTTT
ncbi:hypothetical protein GMORB2_1816 [Geosmithia morbida]|uniref:Late endosomal/lysosomal adaptor and MAPK and MTOR activator-domain-containing protein n=1 Tax=Geosmithia morbida TaxID=1094350 RepID=A0A9P4YUT3_9HYPO|nr:uncharacterized protein GMORB2_1816 [Geosmithia morbida]KAF4121409.1 hypothetical protein GMORB2_1816 [Geosmithia morbida]